MISAVILSKKPVRTKIDGVRVVNHVSTFNDARGLLNARLQALKKVSTEWFFYLDDDDELPTDYARVLERCTSVDTPLAYTDEKITSADGSFKVRKSSEYSEDKFVSDFMLIHHLAVCKTGSALNAAKVIPVGDYTVENLLFFAVAKQGATYIDDVGYIWNRRKEGLSYKPSIVIAQMQSATWAYKNRTVCNE